MAVDAGVLAPGLTTIAIPGAVWGADGAPLRELTLRPATDADELFLVDAGGRLNATECATELLRRCLVSTDARGGLPLAVDALSVGDREAALLQLRRATLGDRLEAVLPCPVPECGELMELDLSIDDLLVPVERKPRREHRLRVGDGSDALHVRFRVPTGGDLAAIAGASSADAAIGADELLRRCVLSATRDGRPVAIEELAEHERDAISAAMAERDPQAVIEMELTCPACGTPANVVFDAGAYLIAELEARAGTLIAEIHSLASHYHWSEADILALPDARRARYLELLGVGRVEPRQLSVGTGG